MDRVHDGSLNETCLARWSDSPRAISPALSGEHIPAAPNWRLRFWGLLAVLLAVRVVLLAAFPLNLIADEAYYWDWSRRLDWAYYSKPPLVAWLIAFSTGIGGSSEFMVRLPATVLSTGGLVFVYLLGSRLYGPRVGFYAAAAGAATPLAAAGTLLMTIDVPFLFCWCAALYAFWRMIERGSQRGLWTLAATLAVGLGLLSKQTMLAFFPSAGLFLLTSPAHRREWTRPACWLWCLGSLLFLAPVVWWNSQHGWVTFQHTTQHFAAEPFAGMRRVAGALEFVASQAGVVSPLTYLLVASVVISGAVRFRQWSARERYLYCFSGPPLVAVGLLSLRQRVEVNWPAAFYVSAIVLVAACAAGPSALRANFGNYGRLLRHGIGIGAFAAAATYGLPFLLPVLGLEGSRLDPTARLRGWEQVGNDVGRSLQGLPSPARTFVIAACGRDVVSELSFYLPGQPCVVQWHPGLGVSSQYDLWQRPRDKRGWDALIVTGYGEPVPPPLAAAFRTVRVVGTIVVPLGGSRSRDLQIWHGCGFCDWPGRPPVRAALVPAH